MAIHVDVCVSACFYVCVDAGDLTVTLSTLLPSPGGDSVGSASALSFYSVWVCIRLKSPYDPMVVPGVVRHH